MTKRGAARAGVVAPLLFLNRPTLFCRRHNRSLTVRMMHSTTTPRAPRDLIAVVLLHDVTVFPSFPTLKPFTSFVLVPTSIEGPPPRHSRHQIFRRQEWQHTVAVSVSSQAQQATSIMRYPLTAEEGEKWEDSTA